MGAGRAYGSLLGTLSLCKDAAVLMHQNTVHKDRRLCQGPKDCHMLCRLPLCIERPLSVALEGYRYVWIYFKYVPKEGNIYQKVQVEMKQQKRDESGPAALFLMAISLTGCPQPRGKLPWTAILGLLRHGGRYRPTRTASNTFPSLFRKSPSKTPQPVRSHPSFASPGMEPDRVQRPLHSYKRWQTHSRDTRNDI